MFAFGSTVAFTFEASVLTGLPSFTALRASTSRVIRSFWMVASWRSASVVLVTLGVSSKRMVASPVYVFGRASEISRTMAVRPTTMAAIRSRDLRRALTYLRTSMGCSAGGSSAWRRGTGVWISRCSITSSAPLWSRAHEGCGGKGAQHLEVAGLRDEERA